MTMINVQVLKQEKSCTSLFKDWRRPYIRITISEGIHKHSPISSISLQITLWASCLLHKIVQSNYICNHFLILKVNRNNYNYTFRLPCGYRGASFITEKIKVNEQNKSIATGDTLRTHRMWRATWTLAYLKKWKFWTPRGTVHACARHQCKLQVGIVCYEVLKIGCRL